MDEKLQIIVLRVLVSQGSKMLVGYIRKVGAEAFKKKAYQLVDAVTNITPWEWDDRYIDPVVKDVLSTDEMDHGIVAFMTGLIALVGEQVAEGFLRDAMTNILVEVRDVFAAEGAHGQLLDKAAA